ncbi:trans-aconitate 2-methyltransferase [Acuticoccus sp. I52.16.1]|uniref:class I SAM-dependent methyltransferase n=1 Tax=Acuticoccus sp. I52.16.1 TaxID=2928472 RepID=UPI001FD46165|nr:class I SAM-dependent methyltransferase [Acuticoccus sp. I52.16.1]UOM35509.1 class I SAM-dependent methyltransferase [Acuticoccus sp. I52.16.1]
MDQKRLEAFVGRMLGDLGAATSVTLARLGDKLGLYKALYAHGPMTSAELATTTSCAERYVREWLAQQAASEYLTYDPATRRFALPPEHAMVFAVEDSPVFMMGAVDLAGSISREADSVLAAFRSGEGIDYDSREGCLFCAMARFFRTGYRNELLGSWIPALGGMVARLEAGARVADVGCGHGHALIMLAEAFPRSSFVGYDFHEGSVTAAREHAAEHGVSERVTFEVAAATSFPGRDFDLVAFFDTLHDLGDPVGAAAHVRRALAPGGTLMVVEPQAADRLEENLNPIGRLYYGGSTMICVPASLAQETGRALGAQAGEAALTGVLNEGGFSSVRRVADSPFNMVLEARA